VVVAGAVADGVMEIDHHGRRQPKGEAGNKKPGLGQRPGWEKVK